MTQVHRIELVFDRECPNADQARVQLRAALAHAGLPPHWTEWERGAPDTPLPLRHLGSPTILVDRSDVAGTNGPEADCTSGNTCRVYAGESGRLQGVPPLPLIITALMGNGEA